MSLVVINPNSTASMTEAMVRAARAAVPGAAIEGWTSATAPRAIQGAEDGALAVPPLLKLVRAASGQGASGLVIGCFDDTGLEEARGIAACPVTGLGEASYALCRLRGQRFSVVTTVAAAIPVIEENLERGGFGPMVGRVRASGVPVLALDDDPAGTLPRLRAEIEAAAREDGVEAVVLGCAGMVNVVEALRTDAPLTLVEPVTAAARLIDVMSKDLRSAAV